MVPTRSGTRAKLREARFFLSQINKLVRKGGPRTPPQLAHFVNAFIAAARSVSHIMKAEYGAVVGWKEWREKFPTSEDESFILKRTTALRNSSLKQKPLKPKLLPMVAPVLEPGANGWMRPCGKVKVLWFLALGNVELHATISRYADYLERLVSECELNFKRPKRAKRSEH